MSDTPDTPDTPDPSADLADTPLADALLADASPDDVPPDDAPSADVPPDRLSTNPRSDWFDADVLTRGIGIRLNGMEKTTVDEYCVSEGWVRVTAGRSRDRRGNPMTMKLSGTVQPYYRDVAPPPADA